MIKRAKGEGNVATKKHKQAKKKQLNTDQKSAILIAAFLLVGSISFLAGAQAQKSKHDADHTNETGYTKTNDHHKPTSTTSYELPQGVAVPTVGVHMSADAKGGYNVHVSTTNFRFTPENVGKSNIDGEGHAHIYVDGKKIARLYGTAYYLDVSKFSDGQHELKVILTTNDHKDIAKDGKLIEATSTFMVE